jgi:chloride channel 7
VSQIFFTPLSQALRLIMHLGEPLPQDRPTFQFNFPVLVLFFILTYVFMTVTNGVGASTGMFVPSLAVGAAGGRIMGRFVKSVVRCACCARV